MKIIYNNLIPFKGFIAINLFGVLFVRNEYKKRFESGGFTTTLNHESIHTEQIKELGYIFFYIWYLIEWLLRLPFGNAYYNISFEREAYTNEKKQKISSNKKTLFIFEIYY